MSSSFSGLTNALTSLNAQSYALSVTGDNIANANNPGYTRQRANLSEVGPTAGVSQLYATPPVTGGGVTSSGASRLNDPVLDSRARAEHGQNGMAQTAQATLSNVEGLFDEPSATGLSEQLNDFWNAWSAVANNPGGNAGAAARSVVLQKSAGIANSLNATSAALGRVLDGTSLQLANSVQQVNSAAAGLAQVNGAIAIATATGSDVNSLADQRDTLLLQLSDLTGASATLQPDGTATVVVGGRTLVAGTSTNAAALDATNKLTVGGAPTSGTTGSVGGLIDAVNNVLPNYASQLDAVAASLASTVNSAQMSGYDLSGAPGGPLFSGSTAGSIAVAVTDPAKLAASGIPGGNFDASVAQKIAGFGSLPGGVNEAYSSLVGNIGTQVQGATQRAVIQQSVTTNVDKLVQSQSGVSFDEETTNLLTYQRSYQASSRVLTTVDEMLDTLINRTGRVGL